MKYYKHTDVHWHGHTYEIRERGRGAESGVLATVTDSVFADRIVDLLNEDEAIEKPIGKRDPGAAAELLEVALAQPRS